MGSFVSAYGTHQGRDDIEFRRGKDQNAPDFVMTIGGDFSVAVEMTSITAGPLRGDRKALESLGRDLRRLIRTEPSLAAKVSGHVLLLKTPPRVPYRTARPQPRPSGSWRQYHVRRPRFLERCSQLRHAPRFRRRDPYQDVQGRAKQSRRSTGQNLDDIRHPVSGPTTTGRSADQEEPPQPGVRRNLRGGRRQGWVSNALGHRHLRASSGARCRRTAANSKHRHRLVTSIRNYRTREVHLSSAA